MNKLEKIERDAQKMREKMAELQNRLKQIDGQRTEQENLQIIQQVRALRLTREELYSFINGGELPASLTGISAAAPEAEPIYSRRGRAYNEATDTDTPETDTDTTSFESEGINHEE